MTGPHRPRRNGWRRVLRSAAGRAWSAALAAALGSALPPPLAARQLPDGAAPPAAPAAQPPAEPAPPTAAPSFGMPAAPPTFGVPAAPPTFGMPAAAPSSGAAAAFGRPAAAGGPEGPMSSFQLPKAAEHIGRPPRPVTQFLTYQYSFGSESDVTYRRDNDLDARLRDNSLIMAPQINGYVLYRPFDELEMMLEVVLEREFAAREENVVTLPDGEQQRAERRHSSLQVDQLWVKYKPFSALEFTLGRRNFEDDRHWLYDTSLDVAHVRFRHASFSGELSYGRKEAVNLDPLKPAQETRIDNYMAYLEYRGIEDIRLAGYVIKRDDRKGHEGKPRLMGLRAYGMPTDRFNFWTELAIVRGEDESKRSLSGHAVDAGATYRFPDLPLHPGVTLGYASGSGDRNRFDNKNTEFRQSGLQSNELKLAGVSKFKYYGEALDPELSNLEILTAGLGFRLSPTFHVDLVYHKYRTNQYTDEIRNWAMTARMNQDPGRPPSHDVGSAFDVVLGFRNLFGVRRLGLDLRAGWFFPGRAFRNDVTHNPANPAFRDADKGISVLAKFWY